MSSLVYSQIAKFMGPTWDPPGSCRPWMGPMLGVRTLAKFMGPTWGPPGPCRPQMGPMLAAWTLLSGFRFSDAWLPCDKHWQPHQQWNQYVASYDVTMDRCAVVIRLQTTSMESGITQYLIYKKLFNGSKYWEENSRQYLGDVQKHKDKN